MFANSTDVLREVLIVGLRNPPARIGLESVEFEGQP